MKIKKVSQSAGIIAEIEQNLDSNSAVNAPSVRAVKNSLNQMQSNVEEIIKGEILWTNPNPTSKFAEQTIEVPDLSQYDYIEIMGKLIYTPDAAQNTFKGKSDFGHIDLYFVQQYNGTMYYFTRSIQRISNTQIKFNNGYDSGNVDDDRCIPIYIIGYKTGLFD